MISMRKKKKPVSVREVCELALALIQAAQPLGYNKRPLTWRLTSQNLLPAVFGVSHQVGYYIPGGMVPTAVIKRLHSALFPTLTLEVSTNEMRKRLERWDKQATALDCARLLATIVTQSDAMFDISKLQ